MLSFASHDLQDTCQKLQREAAMRSFHMVTFLHTGLKPRTGRDVQHAVIMGVIVNTASTQSSTCKQGLCWCRMQSRESERRGGRTSRSTQGRWLNQKRGGSSTPSCCASAPIRDSLSCATAWTSFSASCSQKQPSIETQILVCIETGAQEIIETGGRCELRTHVL